MRPARPAAAARCRAELPSGTVTFLFTDIEESTTLLRTLGDGYADLVGEHRRILSEIAERSGGVVYGAFADEISVVSKQPPRRSPPQAWASARLRPPRCPEESRCVSEWASIPVSRSLGAVSI
jgi:class 3 adenylate cyclase